ncbi:MAG: thiolase family protein, partial [Deltaproteobacteria bacterium]|nr:thiolase family protein [Deltaproteobacteria bacterium]
MNAYLIDARRTAIGRAHPDKGAFRGIRADELLAELIKDVVARALAPASQLVIDDVYVGCVGQHMEQGKNIARLASLLAGLPPTVPGVTINRLCASSLQALNFAAAALHSGQAEVLLAGGVEHMHHVPMAAALDYHQGLLARYEFPFTQMGLTAEKVAEIYGVSRTEQDEFAVCSHQKAVQAQKSGHFEREILPVRLVDRDQGPRPDTNLETLAQMKTVFKENGTVTVGNSSPLSDGASLTLLAEASACVKYGLKKRAQIVGSAVVGLDPCLMGMGPVPAIRKLLARVHMAVDDIDSFEINEAFASQAVACVR